MSVANDSIAQLVKRDPRVLTALRGAMKAGHKTEVLLVENIEEFAPPEIRQAFYGLIEAVVDVTRTLEGE